MPSIGDSKCNGCEESLNDLGIPFVASSSFGRSSLLLDDIADFPGASLLVTRAT